MATDSEGRETSSEGKGRPKVLYLLSDLGIPLYSSIKAGGVHSRAMIQAFLAEGADVEVIALRPGKRKDPLPEAVKVHIVRRGSMRRRWGRWYRFRTTPLWATGVEALLAQRDFLKQTRQVVARTGKPDVIYARHSWMPFSLPRIQSKTKAPLYLEVNALFAQEKSERGELAFPRLSRALERWALRRAERILPVTEALADAMAQLGLPRDRIRVTPNAVDLDLFDAGLRGDAGEANQDGFTIGLASSFRHYHGIKTLIQAVRLLEERIGPVRLRLIGEGPLRSQMEGYARQVGLKSALETPGAVPHRDVPAMLAACDVCVAPYEGDRNLYNCPMKLFEYMALGIPIVASRWGEIPRILKHGETGLLHEAGSSESLAEMLEAVHKDREAARQRAAAALELVRGQTWRGHARWVLDHAASLRGRES